MKNNKILIILLMLILGLLVYLVFKPKDTLAPVAENNPVGEENTQVKDTYTYTNHGFSIELPKGFVPSERQGENIPSLLVSLPKGALVYGTVADWERFTLPSYTYSKDQKIGETIFKVYTYDGVTSYWFKQGNVSYEFNNVDPSILRTFKFVGWPEANEYKEISRSNYSFEAPKNWQGRSLDFKGCDWYSISNNTSDGHRMAGEIGIYPVSCFDLSKSNGKQQVTTKYGYYIISYYDEDTTPAEITEVKEVYTKIISTFKVN